MVSMNTNRVVEGPLRNVMFALAMPVLAEQMLNTFVGLFDTYLAGQIPGREVNATAAVGLAAYVGWLVSMLFLLVGTGTTALVARFVGEGQRDEANRIANQSLLLASGLGIGGFLLIYSLAPSFATWQRMSDDAYPIVVRYLRVESFAHMATAITLVGSAALRGAGDMKAPMYVLSVVNVLNVLVSATLVFGLGPVPSMGVDGIVTGTVTARVSGCLLILAVLARGRGGLRLRWALLGPNVARARRILRIGLPAAVDGAVMWTGHFVFLMIIGRLGAGPAGMALYAAHIVVIRLEGFTYLPASAWSAATATMIGQALGAAKTARARRVAHEGALQCGLLCGAIGVMFFVLAAPIASLMNKDAGVVAATVPILKLVAVFQVFLSSSIIYTGALRGAGDTRYPLLFTLATLLLVRLPLGWLLGIGLQLGLIGAWIAVCVDMVIRAILPLARYVRGRWVATRV
jgi:putative MATE family efflux protein